MWFVLAYLALCALIGFWAVRRGRRFWFWSVFSVFPLTPLGGMFWLLIVPRVQALESHKIRKLLEERLPTKT